MLQTFGARLRRVACTAVSRERAAGALDEAHQSVWEAIRHLFPTHAMVDQCDHGVLLVSWSLPGPRRPHFAAPVLIRIGAGLLLALWTTETTERRAIARLQARPVRDGLAGYDPGARVPTAPVIELGDAAFA